jgi:UDP-N-acetyl-2-amino-2-deoxyglucuronate dehydrogenase
MNKKIKFVVVGFGHIGKRHSEMIFKNEESELVAVVDIMPKSSLDLPEWCDVPFYISLEDFFKSKLEVDVVNICTPNGFHAEQALYVLENNKHVVVEKPIAINKSDAERLIFKALHVKKYFFAVMQNRFSPPSIWIKHIVDSGILGKIFIVQLNCYWNRDERYYTPLSWHGKKNLDGGTLYTQFSHFIDIMYWLFGDIENIQSKIRNFNHDNITEFEDSGIVNFDFINGGIGCLNFSTSTWDKNLESSMTIIAENGSIKIGGQYMDKIDVCHIKNYNMPILPPTNPGNDYGAYKGSAQNHNYVIENVLDVIKNRAIISTNSFEGMKVVDIIERIYQSGNVNNLNQNKIL